MPPRPHIHGERDGVDRRIRVLFSMAIGAPDGTSWPAVLQLTFNPRVADYSTI